MEFHLSRCVCVIRNAALLEKVHEEEEAGKHFTSLKVYDDADRALKD